MLVGETLTNHRAGHALEAVGVNGLAGVETESLLVQISEQVERLDTDIGAPNRAARRLVQAAARATAPAQRLAGAAAPLRERRERGEHPLAPFVPLRAGRRVVHLAHRPQQLELPLAAAAVVLVQRHLYLRCYSRTAMLVNRSTGAGRKRSACYNRIFR